MIGGGYDEYIENEILVETERIKNYFSYVQGITDWILQFSYNWLDKEQFSEHQQKAGILIIMNL